MSQKRRIYPQVDAPLNSASLPTTPVQSVGQVQFYTPPHPQSQLGVQATPLAPAATGNPQIETLTSRMNDLGLNQISSSQNSAIGSPYSTPSSVPTFTPTTLASPTSTSAPPATPATPTTATSVPATLSQPMEPATFGPEVQAPRQFIRMTVNAIPKTMDLQTKAGIPLGCIVHPLAEDKQNPVNVPVVDFGQAPIPRCRQCRTYVNPFIQWLEGGRRWRCNVCGLLNDCQPDYFAPLDMRGVRVDILQRPELRVGCVEFVAPSEYMVRPPMPPQYIFVVDVSYYMVRAGGLATICQTLHDVLVTNTPQCAIFADPRTRICIITFDSSIHFYNLKGTLSKPQMLVVADLAEAFVPQGLDLVVPLHESRTVIATLLTQLPQMFAQTQNTQACVGPALKAAMHVARTIGGKVLLFSAILPSLGVGKLQARWDAKAPEVLSGTEKEVQLLRPQTEFYKSYALDCHKLQISVDVFLLAQQHYVDVATLGTLSQLTGGQLLYFPEFNAARDGYKLRVDLTHVLTRTTGFEAVMRLRCSKGLKVQGYYGHFFLRSQDLLSLPSIDSDKAFGVHLTLSESAIPTPFCTIQSALLYTTSAGERRIRVLNVALPTTTSIIDLFNYADFDVLITLLAKLAIERALADKMSTAREALVAKCVDLLWTYRQILPMSSPGVQSGQLLLPESLQRLPLYILALAKHVALRGWQEVHPDVRASAHAMFRTAPCAPLLRSIYPPLYAVHTLANQSVEETTGRTQLPLLTPLPLSSDKLDRRGVYLLDLEAEAFILWVPKTVSEELCHELFGLPSLINADMSKVSLRQSDDPQSLVNRLARLLDALREGRSIYQPLIIAREGDAITDTKFFSHFVEDRTKNVYSYYEFLVQLQKQVLAKNSR
jgi:protein transport protein SEC24